MAFNIVMLDVAEAEFWEAVDFYHAQRPDLGKSFAREIDRTIKLIRLKPRAFPKVYKTRRRALLQKFPFALFFDILGDTIFVLSVFHNSRDPEIWKNR